MHVEEDEERRRRGRRWEAWQKAKETFTTERLVVARRGRAKRRDERRESASRQRAEQRDEMRGMRNRRENWGHEHDLLNGNLVIVRRVQRIVDQCAWTFSKMDLQSSLMACVFSALAQNATFFKELHFMTNQTGFGVQLSSERFFWIENIETNRHL